MKSVVARAPGKLVLLGEYAVLDGAAGLVTAVDADATVTLEASDRWSLNAPELGIENLVFAVRDGTPTFPAELAPKLRVPSEIIAAVLRAHPLSPHVITTSTQTLYAKANEKIGLGSSAAIATALYAALRAVAEAQRPTTAELFAAVRAAHHAAQGGRGSGIDVAASAYGGTLSYALIGEVPEVRFVEWPRALAMHVVYTGGYASTPQFLAAVAELKAQRRGVYDRLFVRMLELATLGSRAFFHNEARAFVQHAHAYGRVMAELGEAAGVDIVNDAHRALARLAEEYGGAYKPSGAGGGDLGLIFSDNVDTHERLGRALVTGGHKILPLTRATRGVSVSSLE